MHTKLTIVSAVIATVFICIPMAHSQYNSPDGMKTRYPGRMSSLSRFSPIPYSPTISQIAEEYWISNSCEYPPKDFYPLFETACAIPPTANAFTVGLCQAFYNTSRALCHMEGYGEDEKQTVASITALQATLDDDEICDTLLKLNDQDPDLFPLPIGDNEWYKATYDILFSDLCPSACSFSHLHPLCFGFLLNYDVFENKRIEELSTPEEITVIIDSNLSNSTENAEEQMLNEAAENILSEIEEAIETSDESEKEMENEKRQEEMPDTVTSAAVENPTDTSDSKDNEKEGAADKKDENEVDAEAADQAINPKFFPFKDTDPNFFVDYDYGEFFDDEIMDIKDRENLVLSTDIYKDREFLSSLLELEEDIMNGSDDGLDIFEGLVDTPRKKKKRPFPTALKGSGSSIIDEDFPILNMFLLISTLFLILAVVILYNHRQKKREPEAARRILQPGRQAWNGGYERVINDDDDFRH